MKLTIWLLGLPTCLACPPACLPFFLPPSLSILHRMHDLYAACGILKTGQLLDMGGLACRSALFPSRPVVAIPPLRGIIPFWGLPASASDTKDEYRWSGTAGTVEPPDLSAHEAFSAGPYSSGAFFWLSRLFGILFSLFSHVICGLPLALPLASRL